MRPSVGRAEGRPSGGVRAGVIALATVFESVEGVWRGVSRAGSVAVAGLAERGLRALPGGDEPVLVKGVRACMDAVRPGYDIMLLRVENTDGAELSSELSEATPFSTSAGVCSSSSGESDVGWAASGLEADCVFAAKAGWRRDDLTDESARRELARLRELSLLLLRVLRRDNGGVAVLEGRDAGTARGILWWRRYEGYEPTRCLCIALRSGRRGGNEESTSLGGRGL